MFASLDPSKSRSSPALRIWRSRISALFYLVVLVLLATAGTRYAASNYFVQSGIKSPSLEQAEKAALLDPSNPNAYEASGIALRESRNFAAASDAFEIASALRPYDYRLWLSLGDARFQAEESWSAEQAYLKAIELAPAYGLPRIQLGMMYLELGRRDLAFEFLGSAARLDPLYYPLVLHHAGVEFAGDAEAIERAVAPVSKDAKMIFARHLIDRSWMTEATRSFLLGDQLTSAEKNNLISYLTDKNNYRLAREVWLSKIGRDVAAGEPLFDSGFELLTESDPSGLGWQVDHDSSLTSVTRDQKNAHSGTTAINIRFAGNAALQQPIVSQLALVESGKPYRLTFYFRAGELVSAGLPAVIVTDVATKNILAWSEPIEDTKGNWVHRTVTFTAPDTHVVLVSVQRPGCTASPCPIFGEFSIDDISIHAVSP